tara:strand:- start:141 stop:533 length:393 start_codon:yes stop_codon:yes gene_type:complete
MIKYTLLFILSIIAALPSVSFAEWKLMSKSVDEISNYIDFKRIRKQGEYVYFWQLSNYLKPIKKGNSSAKKFIQGDCKKFRYKILSSSYYKEAMGRGRSNGQDPVKKDWSYSNPNSVIATSLTAVCKYIR